MNNESVISKLLPRSLIDELPEPELKGLGLMVREIINSDIFEIDDDYTIHTMYHDVKISLHVLETVETRINEGTRNISCSVEFWNRHICISVPGETPATDDCLIFMMLAKNHWRKDMVPRTLWKPIQRVLGRRTQEEEERKKAEQAELEKKLKAQEAKIAHDRKIERLRSTEKEDWEWILSHYTTEKGAYIPEYY
ncbi:hypothetical protein OAJ45_02950 [Candidatus Poseidoniales archaeon]|nr:hypothetical protein [Candidatus Poseidoniales archaeon]